MRLATGVDQCRKLQCLRIDDSSWRGSASSSSRGARREVDIFSVGRKRDAVRSGWHIDLRDRDDFPRLRIDDDNHRVVGSRVVADAGICEKQQVAAFGFIGRFSAGVKYLHHFDAEVGLIYSNQLKQFRGGTRRSGLLNKKTGMQG